MVEGEGWGEERGQRIYIEAKTEGSWKISHTVNYLILPRE